MHHHEFLLDLQGLFRKHGKPEPTDHSAAILHLLVLQLEGMEALLTTAAELQGKVNSLSDKFSQLEADVLDLVSKAGGTAGTGGTTGAMITQDQLDSMGTAVDNVLGRIDTLAKTVVAGPPPAPTPEPTPTPTTTPPSSGLTPGVQTTPLGQATQGT
jgi:hypothetical protein